MLPIAVSPPPKWMRGLIFLNKKVEKGAGGGGRCWIFQILKGIWAKKAKEGELHFYIFFLEQK